MTIDAIRRRNLLALVQQETKGNIAAFSRRFDLNQKYIRLIKGGQSNCGSQFARDVEAALARVNGGDWAGWMDRDHGNDLDEDALLVARRWKALSADRRAFLLSQFMLAEKLNFGENPQTNSHSSSYGRLIEEFRTAPYLAHDQEQSRPEIPHVMKHGTTRATTQKKPSRKRN